MRLPFHTAILRVDPDTMEYHETWWRHIRQGARRAVIHLMCLDPAIERMLQEPIANPEAAVDVLIAEDFMNGACDVPGWLEADPDNQPVRFIGPDEVAHELDPGRDNLVRSPCPQELLDREDILSEPIPSKPGDHDENQNADDSWYDDLSGADDIAGFGFTIGEPQEDEEDDEDEEGLETDPEQD